MSTSDSDEGDGIPPVDPSDAEYTPTREFDPMIESLDMAIAEARRKVESGRVYDEDKEKVRIKWIKALAYCVNIRRQITADAEIEELRERIEALEDGGLGGGL